MVITKQLVLRALLLVEVMSASIIFIFGSQGIIAVSKKNEEHKKLINAIELEKQEIIFLNKEIHNYNSIDFYKEKIAREDLQMARPEEQVYILENK